MKYEKWTVAPPDPAALAALEEAGISPLLAAVLSAGAYVCRRRPGPCWRVGRRPWRTRWL